MSRNGSSTKLKQFRVPTVPHSEKFRKKGVIVKKKLKHRLLESRKILMEPGQFRDAEPSAPAPILMANMWTCQTNPSPRGNPGLKRTQKDAIFKKFD
jgi:hypothetical protein